MFVQIMTTKVSGIQRNLVAQQLLAIVLIFNCSRRTVTASLTMQSRGLVIDEQQGSTAELPCEFISDDYSLFDNPILWKKGQSHETTSVNIMGNILEPFLSTNRFDIKFLTLPPLYQLSLRITNLSAVDSGNYSCEVRGRRSTVLASVSHSIAVQTAVQRVIIDMDDRFFSQADELNLELARPDERITVESPRRVLFIESVAQIVTCVGEGGYPLPDMSIFIGSRDVTAQFQLVHLVTLNGTKGLRTIAYRTVGSCDRFSVTSLDDQQPIECVVTVPGMMPFRSAAVITNVIYRPQISCSQASAYLGERDVSLRCDVRARPPLSALFWVVDHNGTTVIEGQLVNEYSTLVRDRNDGVMETQLFLKQVLSRSFRTYTLIAENSLSAQTYDVILTQKFRPAVSLDLIQDDRPVAGSSTLNDVKRRLTGPDPEYTFVKSSTTSHVLFARKHYQLANLILFYQLTYLILFYHYRTDSIQRLITVMYSIPNTSYSLCYV